MGGVREREGNKAEKGGKNDKGEMGRRWKLRKEDGERERERVRGKTAAH